MQRGACVWWEWGMEELCSWLHVVSALRASSLLLNPGGSGFLCFCYTVREQRLLLKSACCDIKLCFDWECSDIYLST